ncbi:AAA family ATPase [Streptomyces sp. RB110-1]|nr:AAA family ATPase [Streptomyces sp. RB110-1]MBK0384648.1 AAA family ATPase [Streptomyces sp. RB110-2]
MPVGACLLREHSRAPAYAASRHPCGVLSVLVSMLSVITDERALSGGRAMAYVQHLSVRVPWHDTGWAGTVCADPGANHACVMLGNIAKDRDVRREAAHAGAPWSKLGQVLPPCVVERGGFMSSSDHAVRRTHPYGWFLKDLRPARLEVPAFSVHAIPYFWMNRSNAEEVVLQERPVSGYSPEAEERIAAMLDSRLPWVMHGENQQAIMKTFFRDVVAEQSLVFFYLKHSPFENQPRRMLVGAACVSGQQPPPPWPGSANSTFPSHMWETTLRHSLRPDGTGGILLPMQALAAAAARGMDVASALARAPEVGRNFSYATEHVSSDSTVASLMELRRAAQAATALGDPAIGIPETSLQWLDDQLHRAWKRRGPCPGLPAVLAQLGFRHPTFAAHKIISAAGEKADPWPVLENILEGETASAELSALATQTRRRIWAGTGPQERQALRVLSRFDLTSEAVSGVLRGATSVPVGHDELLANPYDLVTCTVDDGEPIAFETVDRGCFPDLQLTEHHPLPLTQPFDDANDRRRIDAAMTAVLLRAQEEGHTLLPVEQMAERLGQLTLAVPLATDETILRPLGLAPEALLDSDSHGEPEVWSQLRRVDLASGKAAYKLASAALRRDFIRERLNQLRDGKPHRVPADLAKTLDTALSGLAAAADSDSEARARMEKTAAFGEMFHRRVTIVNGPAGTGKTTLIQALAKRSEVTRRGLLLLAPTGKARVQLEQKVGYQALTLAQFLRHSDRYDDVHGRYRTLPDGRRIAVGTVVVDEASMLTEDMLAALLDAVEITERLILVGDPRQLPPIGAGRPFVDLERRRRPDHSNWPRVAPGWAELTVLHRQQGHTRDDLALAHWYSGDKRSEDAEEVWEKLRTRAPMATLKAVHWNGRPAARVLDDVLREEFTVTDELSFTHSYGATTRTDAKGNEYPNYTHAPGSCDRWQALSPTRGQTHGTVELNRYLKQTYRRRALADAQLIKSRRRVPQPLGPEQIVVGDKVVNTRNQYLRAFRPSTGKPEDRSYVANGELGVVTGQLKSKKMTGAPWQTQVEFSSQPDLRFAAQQGLDDDPGLELAWALTVHKSQGSEFGTVVLMLPAHISGISRELLYTALTRQTRKVIICHEGPLEDLRELAQPTASDTARRLTDLTRPPEPVVVHDRQGRRIGCFDANLIHITHFGLPVSSKNEVIIADLLHRLARGRFEYEQPLTGRDGKTKFPDFTITTDDPDKPIYWEHLGMLDSPRYRETWERKKAWYAAQGILPGDTGGPNGLLLITDDRNGVKEQEWEATFRKAFGSTASIRPRSIGRRRGSP